MRKEMKLSTKAIQIALLVCIALLMCVIPFSLPAEEGVAQAEEDENVVEFKLQRQEMTGRHLPSLQEGFKGR